MNLLGESLTKTAVPCGSWGSFDSVLWVCIAFGNQNHLPPTGVWGIAWIILDLFGIRMLMKHETLRLAIMSHDSMLLWG